MESKINFILSKITKDLENKIDRSSNIKRFLKIKKCVNYEYSSAINKISILNKEKKNQPFRIKSIDLESLNKFNNKENFYLNKLLNQSKAIEEVLKLVSESSNDSKIILTNISNFEVDNNYLLESKMISHKKEDDHLKKILQNKPSRLTPKKMKKLKKNKPSQNLKFFRNLQKKFEQNNDNKNNVKSNLGISKHNTTFFKSEDKQLKNFLQINESSEIQNYKIWEAQLLKKK